MNYSIELDRIRAMEQEYSAAVNSINILKSDLERQKSKLLRNYSQSLYFSIIKEISNIQGSKIRTIEIPGRGLGTTNILNNMDVSGTIIISDDMLDQRYQNCNNLRIKSMLQDIRVLVDFFRGRSEIPHTIVFDIAAANMLLKCNTMQNIEETINAIYPKFAGITLYNIKLILLQDIKSRGTCE